MSHMGYFGLGSQKQNNLKREYYTCNNDIEISPYFHPRCAVDYFYMPVAYIRLLSSEQMSCESSMLREGSGAHDLDQLFTGPL